jgi:hypothetical protein
MSGWEAEWAGFMQKSREKGARGTSGALSKQRRATWRLNREVLRWEERVEDLEQQVTAYGERLKDAVYELMFAAEDLQGTFHYSYNRGLTNLSTTRPHCFETEENVFWVEAPCPTFYKDATSIFRFALYSSVVRCGLQSSRSAKRSTNLRP